MSEFYRVAVTKLGLDPILAWDYTPYEISLIAKQYSYQQKEKLKENIVLAYYTEAFARHKKLPKLEKVLKGIDKPKKESKGDMVLRAMALKKQ